MTSLHDLLLSRIRSGGPMTVAEFMELALYHPEYGYYATAPRRSGRHGDFFTSVDVGPLFGELLAAQLAEMWRLVRAAGASRFDFVEAAAGNGRLARDILDAAAAEHRDLYDHIRVSLVERSAAARAEHPTVLGPHARKLHGSGASLPSAATGTIFANELLDALPVHVVTMTADGLREVYITEVQGRLAETQGAVSDPAVLEHIDALGAVVPRGVRVEVGLAAARWTEAAAAALDRGFLLLIDYGHHVDELFSATHANGTLAAYRGHAFLQDWMGEPGTRDLTSHVNLTAIERAAESAGLASAGTVDQTYFLTSLGLAERLESGTSREMLIRRLAAKTLILPGGLGSTMKVMAFSRGVGEPRLKGFASGRLT